MPGWPVALGGEVADALSRGGPVVALESTLIAQGLPWPTNLETALAAEEAVRNAGAVPATIAVWRGVPTIGLTRVEIEDLARAPGVLKASRRDLAVAIGLKRTAATTVSATLALAHHVGLRVFATGGIGGAHRDNPPHLPPYPGQPFDISADLGEIARTPLVTVSAGAKSLLDLPRTLEILETLSVPVLGYRCDHFPAFYVRQSHLPVMARVETVQEVARIVHCHQALGGGGVLLTQPCPAELALDREEFEAALHQAEADARTAGIHGPELTPFLLRRLCELTHGRVLEANRGLVVSNAALAAAVAVELGQSQGSEAGPAAVPR